MQVFFSILLLAAGGFSLLGAVNDWDWFFASYKAQRMVNLFGRKGARVVYGLIGAFIILIGIMTFGRFF